MKEQVNFLKIRLNQKTTDKTPLPEEKNSSLSSKSNKVNCGISAPSLNETTVNLENNIALTNAVIEDQT